MIFIILLVSVVALPVVLPAFNHRQVSEAGRILQGTLVGARDSAIHLNRPAGIRLLPDPTFPLAWVTNNNGISSLDPTQILAYNRIIALEGAPEYSEGMCTPIAPGTATYLAGVGAPLVLPTSGPIVQYPALVLIENLVNPKNRAPDAPTSWFWNIRVGDKIQLNGAGAWYTVIGPMALGPQSNPNSNPELFVNAGPPGPIGQSATPVPTVAGQPVEYLLLVNGQDDNNNGWIDEGWDGVNNNGNGNVDELLEWETESYLGAILTHTAVERALHDPAAPMASSTAHEVALPTQMVIDATTWNLGANRERSRLPINSYSGYIDVVINPDGTVLPQTIYSSPASVGMDSAFYHFWIAERQDLAPPTLGATVQPFLPIAQPGGSGATTLAPPFLKGEYAILTLSARTGNIVVNQGAPFLYNSSIGYNAQSGTYNPTNPFIQAEQGLSGGR